MGKYSFARRKPKQFNYSVSNSSSSLQRRSVSVAKPEDNTQKSAEKIPDLQTQLIRAARQGHNLSRMTKSYQQSLVQTKLAIGQPGDVYEQEADRTAEQVVNQPQPVQTEKEETNEVQKKNLQREGGMPSEDEEMQAKPLVGNITPLIQKESMPSEDEEMQAKPLQRQAGMPSEDEEMQAKPLQPQAGMPEESEKRAQPKESGNTSQNNNMEGLESKLSQSKGGGTPLSEETRNFMEPRFGTDFSDVKVHNDSNAAEMNTSIQAQAFTQGQDIYFNSGKYDPDSNGGKQLLAHELTHVMQQRGGK